MISKKWRKMFNPVDWVSFIYGKWFVGHSTLGFLVISIPIVAIGLLLLELTWLRGVDKYNQEHFKNYNSPTVTSVKEAPQLTEEEKGYIIVDKLIEEYVEKHNVKPSVDWLNAKLKEEGYNFSVKLNKPVKRSKVVGIWVENSKDITLENITSIGVDKGVVLKNTENVKAINIKTIDP